MLVKPTRAPMGGVGSLRRHTERARTRARAVHNTRTMDLGKMSKYQGKSNMKKKHSYIAVIFYRDP